MQIVSTPLWWQMTRCPDVMMTLLTNRSGPSKTDPGQSWHNWEVSPVILWQYIGDRVRPTGHDQWTRPHTLRVCSHVKMLSDWLTLLDFEYSIWWNLLRMFRVDLKASQYLAKLFQWSGFLKETFRSFTIFIFSAIIGLTSKCEKGHHPSHDIPLWRW